MCFPRRTRDVTARVETCASRFGFFAAGGLIRRRDHRAPQFEYSRRIRGRLSPFVEDERPSGSRPGLKPRPAQNTNRLPPVKADGVFAGGTTARPDSSIRDPFADGSPPVKTKTLREHPAPGEFQKRIYSRSAPGSPTQRTRRCCSAVATASVRLVAPSLARMLLT
jgi:hypothetical protein